MSRTTLSNRRACETFSVECQRQIYTCTVSRFGDGSVAELFLSNGKAGSDSDANARDAAIVFSIARQYGVPVEAIRLSLTRDANGVAGAPLGAALDTLARWG